MITAIACGLSVSLVTNFYLIYRMSVVKKKMRMVSEITTELSTLSQTTYNGLQSLHQKEE